MSRRPINRKYPAAEGLIKQREVVESMLSIKKELEQLIRGNKHELVDEKIMAYKALCKQFNSLGQFIISKNPGWKGKPTTILRFIPNKGTNAVPSGFTMDQNVSFLQILNNLVSIAVSSDSKECLERLIDQSGNRFPSKITPHMIDQIAKGDHYYFDIMIRHGADPSDLLSKQNRLDAILSQPFFIKRAIEESRLDPELVLHKMQSCNLTEEKQLTLANILLKIGIPQERLIAYLEPSVSESGNASAEILADTPSSQAEVASLRELVITQQQQLASMQEMMRMMMEERSRDRAASAPSNDGSTPGLFQ